MDHFRIRYIKTSDYIYIYYWWIPPPPPHELSETWLINTSVFQTQSNCWQGSRHDIISQPHHPKAMHSSGKTGRVGRYSCLKCRQSVWYSWTTVKHCGFHGWEAPKTSQYFPAADVTGTWRGQKRTMKMSNKEWLSKVFGAEYLNYNHLHICRLVGKYLPTDKSLFNRLNVETENRNHEFTKSS